MTDAIIDARLVILNGMVSLSKMKAATTDEVKWALDWFKKNQVPVALQPITGRYERVLTWPKQSPAE